MIISSRATVERRLPWFLAAAAALAGVAAWAVFFRAGLVLSHYDAKAHLVVARRIIDNLTPGWQQIGAVWLPLPHLIELLPTQADLLYRTGAFASLVSIGCLAVTTYAAAILILRVTGSCVGAAVCTALLVLNPNVLYLHTTPMTEPLLLATSMLVVLWLFQWVEDGRDTVPPKLAVALFAAAWTRYEAWAVIGAAIAAAGYAMWRRGGAAPTVLRRLSWIAIWPALAVAIFLVNSHHRGRPVRQRRLLRARSDVRASTGQNAAGNLVGHAPIERLYDRNGCPWRCRRHRVALGSAA